MVDAAHDLYRHLLEQVVLERPVEKTRTVIDKKTEVTPDASEDSIAYQKLFNDFVHSPSHDAHKLKMTRFSGHGGG